MERVHIGQKLNLEDIIRSDWQKKYAEPSLLGSMLKECGVAFVEFTISAETDVSVVCNLAGVFADAGLFVSLDFQSNRFSPEIFNPESNSYFIEWLRTAQSVGNITKVPVPCVFHCGLGSSVVQKRHQEVLSISRDFFFWLDKMTLEGFGNVVGLCEAGSFCAENKKQQENWGCCLRVIEGTNLGICWDFGHRCLSSTGRADMGFPGENFLAIVNHVHAYDAQVSDSGTVEVIPLADGMIPWREYCSLLARHDYDSTVLLKVNPEYYSGLRTFLQGVTDGVNKLRIFFS